MPSGKSLKKLKQSSEEVVSGEWSVVSSQESGVGSRESGVRSASGGKAPLPLTTPPNVIASDRLNSRTPLSVTAQ